MAPNQYGDDEVAQILAIETQQRQDSAAREALGERPPAPPEPLEPPQRAKRPSDRP